MIENKIHLKQFLNTERELYGFSNKRRLIIAKLQCSSQYYRWKYNYYLRHAEYWKNSNKSIRARIMFFYYRRKKNKLGVMLGFDISENCFEKGLVIFHSGSVVVNPKAKVGENCHIVGNVCIGNQSKNGGAPKIGKNLIMGNGSSIIGDVILPDNVTVGAGAVVTRSFISDKEKERLILVGVPAKELR